MAKKGLANFEVVFLTIILLVGSFFRLYRLRDTLIFQGDQGRDAIIARAILKEGDLALIGPVTSAGNMYLGPLYYYLMVPALALTYPDPVGPAYLVAILGIFTVWVMYKVVREMYGVSSAMIATAIYSVLNLAVVYSRFSWNPNPAPLAGLLTFYATYKAVVTRKYKWFLGAFIGYAVLIQLHYIALLMGGVIGVGVIRAWFKSKNKKELSTWIVFGVLILVGSFLPLLVFDVTHDWVNWRAFLKFMARDEYHIKGIANLSAVFRELEGRTFRSVAQILGTYEGWPDRVAAFVPMLGLAYVYKKGKISNKKKTAIGLLVAWIGFAIVGTSFYSSSIFDHYLSYLYTAPVILVGMVGGMLVDKSKKWLAPVLMFVGWIIWLNVKAPAALAESGPKIDMIEKVSGSIVDRVNEGEKYNLVLVADGGDIDAQNYRYFLTTSDKPPVKKEERGEVEKLFVIREVVDERKVVDSPVYEIVVFPNKNPSEVYTIGETEITVLEKENE